jgi:hypothetical protein
MMTEYKMLNREITYEELVEKGEKTPSNSPCMGRIKSLND